MGQPIFGHSNLLAQQVVLDCDPKLVGDSLSIHLAQQGGSSAVWTLDVWVQIAQGEFFVGRIVTTAPSAGNNPSRTVGIATIPGAIGWSVQATCPTDDEAADLTLQSSRCCTAAIGLIKIGSSQNTSDVTIVGPSNLIDPWTNTFSTALANSFIVKAALGTLRNMTVRVDSTLATGTYYLQLWNLAALPADTTVVGAGNSLEAPTKVVHAVGTNDLVTYDFAELGIPFSAGCVLGISSTEFTKTAVAGAFLSVIGAEYR